MAGRWLANMSGGALANNHHVDYNIVLTNGIVIGFVWLAAYSLGCYRHALDGSTDTFGRG